MKKRNYLFFPERDIRFCSRGQRMVLFGPKRRLAESICEGTKNDQIDEKHQEFETAAMGSGLNFPILELDTNIIYDILSRLPFRSILACRCVCRMFLKLLTDDPYFAQLHLARAPKTVSLVLQRCVRHQRCLAFYLFDLDQGLRASPCSVDCHHSTCIGNHSSLAIAKQKAEFCFFERQATLVGECNGLLCLYGDSFYMICNPILGEYLFLPYPTPLPTPAYTNSNQSGFGYSPKTGQYKVIHFATLTSVDPLTSLTSREMVVDIHTLGSGSWRRIYNVPCPKIQRSFDPLLNGSLHWITDSPKPAELICSLDLESECFTFLPPPSHFSMPYVNKISWTNVGIFRGCLCLCYVYENSHFEAWVMKDYSVKESWTKEFSIDIKFYSGLREVDFHRPLKFLNNGDLWLHCSLNRLVSYNPQTGTFRDFEVLGRIYTEVFLHYPSFISLQHALGGKNLTVVTDGRGRRGMIAPLKFP